MVRLLLIALGLSTLSTGCLVPYRYPDAPYAASAPPPVAAGERAPAGRPTAAPAPRPPGPGPTSGPGGGYRAASGDRQDGGRGVQESAQPGDYERYWPRFMVTVEGSRAIEHDGHLWGLGFYALPEGAPFGLYLNTRFTPRAGGDPDFTDVFAFNAFGHQVVDEEVEAFVINVGAIQPLNESVNLFAGLGFATSAIEVELRDPMGTFGNNGRYFQRRNEHDELNVNLGALISVEPVAVTVQWDTALEVFTFGVGVVF